MKAQGPAIRKKAIHPSVVTSLTFFLLTTAWGTVFAQAPEKKPIEIFVDGEKFNSIDQYKERRVQTMQDAVRGVSQSQAQTQGDSPPMGTVPRVSQISEDAEAVTQNRFPNMKTIIIAPRPTEATTGTEPASGLKGENLDRMVAEFARRNQGPLAQDFSLKKAAKKNPVLGNSTVKNKNTDIYWNALLQEPFLHAEERHPGPVHQILLLKRLEIPVPFANMRSLKESTGQSFTQFLLTKRKGFGLINDSLINETFPDKEEERAVVVSSTVTTETGTIPPIIIDRNVSPPQAESPPLEIRSFEDFQRLLGERQKKQGENGEKNWQ